MYIQVYVLHYAIVWTSSENSDMHLNYISVSVYSAL